MLNDETKLALARIAAEAFEAPVSVALLESDRDNLMFEAHDGSVWVRLPLPREIVELVIEDRTVANFIRADLKALVRRTRERMAQEPMSRPKK